MVVILPWKYWQNRRSVDSDIILVDIEKKQITNITEDNYTGTDIKLKSLDPVTVHIDLTPVWLPDNRTVLFQRISKTVDIQYTLSGQSYTTDFEFALQFIWFFPKGRRRAKMCLSDSRYGGLYLISTSFDGRYALVYYQEMLREEGWDDLPPTPYHILDMNTKELKAVLSDNHKKEYIYKNALLSKDGSKILFTYSNGEKEILSVRDYFRYEYHFLLYFQYTNYCLLEFYYGIRYKNNKFFFHIII